MNRIQDSEHKAALALAREMAIALREPANRKMLIASMHASRITEEHKLAGQEYLATSAGRRLSASATAAHPETPVSLSRLATTVRPTEIYMPVREHRNTWTGSEDVIVAVQLDEDDPVIGFDLQGNRIALSDSAAPKTAVIAIVGAEADFTQPLPAEFTDVRDAAKGSVGSLGRLYFDDPNCSPYAIIPCDNGGGGGGGGGGVAEVTPNVPGLWIQGITLFDDGEHWIRGVPEVELFVHVLHPNGDVSEIGISGQNGDGARYFNQNSTYWSRTSSNQNSEGLVLNAGDIDLLEAGNRTFSIHLWEDDQDPRRIVRKQPGWWERAGAAADLVTAGRKFVLYAGACKKSGLTYVSKCLQAVDALFKVPLKIAKFAQSEDDELGIVTFNSPTTWNGRAVGTLRRGSATGNNGSIVLLDVD